MSFIKFVFWFSFIIVLYTYIGYGLLLFLLVTLKKIFFKSEQKSGPVFQPPITLVISALNEEEFIETKIRNTLELVYPEDKLDIIFITDGSTDSTPHIISKYNRFTLLHQPERQGKAAAMNRAVKQVKTPYVVFCDANTLLNKECIAEIAKHYADALVGGVAGEKVIMESRDGSAATAGEGLYWKYESFLKKLDSDLFSVVGAAGELFSLRTELYESIEEGTIIEDFVLSLRICEKGYRIRYEPNAYAMESGSESMKDEQKRKVRISAGAFQAMGMVKQLFNIFRFPVLSFQFISHRILRWTLCPLCLFLLVVSNLVLVAMPTGDFYRYFLAAQLLFYILAIIGWTYANKDIKIKLLYVPYYFFFMNVSVYMGFNRFLKKKQSVLWERAVRKKIP